MSSSAFFKYFRIRFWIRTFQILQVPAHEGIIRSIAKKLDLDSWSDFGRSILGMFWKGGSGAGDPVGYDGITVGRW